MLDRQFYDGFLFILQHAKKQLFIIYPRNVNGIFVLLKYGHQPPINPGYYTLFGDVRV